VENATMLLRTALAAAVLAGFSLVTTASAEEGERRPQKPGVSAAKGLSGPNAVSANAPNVRVALVYDGDDGEVVRSKGVTDFRNPAAGYYCIRVANLTGSQVRRLVPQVTVWYEGGEFEVNLAYYSTSGRCRSTEIGVVTKRLRSGSFINSDFVGFSLLAP
jgi:hypothetical protein